MSLLQKWHSVWLLVSTLHSWHICLTPSFPTRLALPSSATFSLLPSPCSCCRPKVLHHAALSHNLPPWAVSLAKILVPGLLLLLLGLAWRYVYAGMGGRVRLS